MSGSGLDGKWQGNGRVYILGEMEWIAYLWQNAIDAGDT